MRFQTVILAIGLMLLVHPLSASRSSAADPLPVMRISVENAPSHVQAQAVRRFADALKTRLDDVLDIRFHDSARFYRDQDVFAALEAGRLEMAVPGTWHVAKYEPNTGLFLLPAFYGRSAEDTHRVLNSTVGTELTRRIENALNVVVPGSWMDLGHAHLFTRTARITTLDNIRNLRIRVAGGRANELRLQAVGAKTMSVPWPDFPRLLAAGDVDGTLTTYETIRSARLWEKGINHVYEDGEYFPQYVPIIAARFWQRLTPRMRSVITTAWEEAATWEREAARQAQADAKQQLENHGAEIIVPSLETARAWREVLLKDQDAVIVTLGLDQDLVNRAMRHLDR